MPSPSSPVRIEFVATSREIDDALWSACFPSPWEGRFWYQTLEACGLEDQFDFHYAVIKTGDRPVGIVPCFVHDVPVALVAPAPVAWCFNFLSRFFPRAGCQRTFFIGSPCADEGRIGLAPGAKPAEVIGPLAEALRAKARALNAPMMVFKDFPAADLPALETLCGGKSDFFRMPSYPGTRVRLPAPDKHAYLRALSGPHRHNLSKKLRRSKELLALETSIVDRPSDAELAEIFGLFMQTYERGKTKFERLNLRFFENIRGQAPARFILQRDPATGELLTFMLVFSLGGRLINKFIGLDYRRAGRTFLYFRLFDAALDFAYATGAAELQSGQTGYRAKLDLGHELVPLFNLVRHENPLVHAVYRAIGRRVTWRTLDGDLANFLRAHPECDRRAAEG
ncbi:MAG TPA: hypothetical protein VMI53_02545 [Opitutaceae bacterium]|nr:hypothetical protein [Opitutaceae bacterium]